MTNIYIKSGKLKEIIGNLALELLKRVEDFSTEKFNLQNHLISYSNMIKLSLSYSDFRDE